jgi:hypothetical protein
VFQKGESIRYKKGKVYTRLLNKNTNKPEDVVLLPMGKTILRQVTF